MISKVSFVLNVFLSMGYLALGSEAQPQWLSININHQGQIELDFIASDKQTYVIEASDDLQDWRVVSDPIEVSTNAAKWIPPKSNVNHQFYRLALFDRDWMRSQFEENRRLWNEQALSEYSYVFSWSCFCLPDYTAPVKIEVEQGEWSSISFVADGKPVIEDNWQRYNTIDELFEMIEDAFKQDAVAIHAEYDSELGYPTSVFIDYSELIADEERGFSVTLHGQPSIQFVSQNPFELGSDPFRLLNANVDGDLLEIEVEYGGGCREHQFELIANPKAFMESEPVQANIYFLHENHDDLCKALVRKKYTFSLQPLKEAFRELYPAGNALVLNVHGFHLSEDITELNVLYPINQ